MPAAAVLDAGPPPHARRAGEVHKQAVAVASGLFNDEVRVERERLPAREQVLLLVEVRPARLHQPQPVVGEEVGHNLPQEARRGREVGVKDGDKRRVVLLQSVGERACLVALSRAAAYVLNLQPGAACCLDGGGGNGDSVVGRVVEYLHRQPVARVVQPGDRLDEPLNDVALVEDGKLHQNRRQVSLIGGWGCGRLCLALA